MDGEGAPLHPGRGREVLRVASLKVNGMSGESKRKEVMESAKKGRLDVTGLQETHRKGCGVGECLGVTERGV